VVKQILEGMSYVHSVGVAHRDLKPENLLCDGDRVVVADFGLAKIFGRGDLLKTHVGTPNYAAPEIVRGDDTYDKAVDMWSIGVITYVL
jgi:serine/threonine protein kinase